MCQGRRTSNIPHAGSVICAIDVQQSFIAWIERTVRYHDGTVVPVEDIDLHFSTRCCVFRFKPCPAPGICRPGSQKPPPVARPINSPFLVKALFPSASASPGSKDFQGDEHVVETAPASQQCFPAQEVSLVRGDKNDPYPIHRRSIRWIIPCPPYDRISPSAENPWRGCRKAADPGLYRL